MAKVLKGKVVSTKMTNTVVVEVVRRTPHPLYKKLLKRSNKFLVDPAGREVSVGDTVSIVEIRPMSKNKYFRLQEDKK